MQTVSKLAESLGNDWLPTVYRDKIRSQRTRAIVIQVPTRENECVIQHTLLGIELKVGKRRFACPDLATARYMRVFARIGCGEFAIPYDITKISGAADELETTYQKSLILLAESATDLSPKSANAARSKLIKTMRTELAEIGPGDAMPAFDRLTRQR